jgi:subtilase family serine protease
MLDPDRTDRTSATTSAPRTFQVNSLNGSGQVVGLFEFGGYFAVDIARYENQAGLPNVPVVNVLIDGFNGVPTSRRPGSNNEEVALDIEMAISMAPGLSQVLVYECSPTAPISNR